MNISKIMLNIAFKHYLYRYRFVEVSSCYIYIYNC